MNSFIDLRNVRTLGGQGGDGSISFLSLFANENAGKNSMKIKIIVICSRCFLFLLQGVMEVTEVKTAFLYRWTK